METCEVAGESLSRFLDAELPILEYRRVRDHVQVCPSCARRLRGYRLTSDMTARAMADRTDAARPTVWLSVAAALLASLATNLLLPAAGPEGRAPVFKRSAPTSEGLSAFYARVASIGANPEVRD
jgi:anti-sigma factor RsiW